MWRAWADAAFFSGWYGSALFAYASQKGRYIYTVTLIIIWASLREILSSGFPTKWDQNQPAQLQVIARKLKFRS